MVELIIVMVLIGILAAVAVPKMGNTITSGEEASEDAIISALESAIEMYAMDQVVTNSNRSYPTNPFDHMEKSPQGYTGENSVLDEDGEFNKRCNLSMVELEPIASEDDLLERLHHHGGDLETKGKVDVLKSMTKFDDERIYKLVSNHYNYTNSEKAKQILDNWEKYLPNFVKVMPVDYRRALLELESKKTLGFLSLTFVTSTVIDSSKCV